MKDEETSRMVKEWFAQTVDHEWRRLRQDAYHQLEFALTMHCLTKYLPEKGLILDAGGGPGRYTIELAKQGYEVILLDLVPEMLKAAERKIRRAGVKKKVKQIIEGSIDDLSMFGDETFDAVLCLGGPSVPHTQRATEKKGSWGTHKSGKAKCSNICISDESAWTAQNASNQVST